MIETFKVGCYILAIGMSTVFVFLAIMIFVMEISAKIIAVINKYCPEEVEEDKYASCKKKTDNDAEVALAIACALHKEGAKC